jgi:hypothetical protein
MILDLDAHSQSVSDRVNIGDSNDMSQWCAQLGCTQTQLRGALLAVGVAADDIEAYAHADE